MVVWITAPTVEEARSLSDGLIAQELAACVNLMPGIESVYKWEGKVRVSAAAAEPARPGTCRSDL